MDTDHTTIRTTALAACLALLFAGATACGTEDAATPAKTGPASLSSIDLIEMAKANQQQYLRHLKSERPNAARPTPGFGDDRREAIHQARRSHPSAPPPHSLDFDKALPSEW
jgi:hypothetical protein